MLFFCSQPFFITTLPPPSCSSEGPESPLARGCCPGGEGERRCRWSTRQRRRRSSPCLPSSSTPLGSILPCFSPLSFLLLNHLQLHNYMKVGFWECNFTFKSYIQRCSKGDTPVVSDEHCNRCIGIGVSTGPSQNSLQIIYASSMNGPE